MMWMFLSFSAAVGGWSECLATFCQCPVTRTNDKLSGSHGYCTLDYMWPSLWSRPFSICDPSAKFVVVVAAGASDPQPPPGPCPFSDRIHSFCSHCGICHKRPSQRPRNSASALLRIPHSSLSAAAGRLLWPGAPLYHRWPLSPQWPCWRYLYNWTRRRCPSR